MHLYLLKPIKPWEPWYDKVFGFVIRAEGEAEARWIASKKHGDEGREVWLDPLQTSCVNLEESLDKGLILRDMRSA